MLRYSGKRLFWAKLKLTNWCCWMEYLSESVVGGLKIRDRFPVQLRPTPPQVGSTQVPWHPTESQKSMLSGRRSTLVGWGQGVPQRSHHTTDLTWEIYWELYTKAASERGWRGKREKQKARDRETDRVRQTDRQGDREQAVMAGTF